MNGLSVYIHWPFCAAKCPYCDFSSRAMPREVDQEAWALAYLRELAWYAALLPEREIATIYFGGGTPSLMNAATIAAILNKIAALWKVQQNCEITLEANPSSSESAKFQAFRAAGVNRLSLGVQALNDADLRFLGRPHDQNAAREALEIAQKTFDRVSFDLIYARPQQTPAAWAAELREALAFGVGHLSLYQLTVEEGTPFAKRARGGEVLTAGEDTAVALFEMTQELMTQAGLPAYEISNHARAGQESRHNLTYWHYGDYIGIGPGAHGRYCAAGQRWASANLRHPDAWRAQVMAQGEGAETREMLESAAAQREALMMGLRLASGIDRASWRAKFGGDVADFLDAEKLGALQREGLLTLTDAHLAATAMGRQRLNAVLGFLV